MNIGDWFQLIALILFLLSDLVVYALGHAHFKTRKAQAKADAVKRLTADYVAFYDKQELSNSEKLSGAVSDVVNALKSNGFNISKQDEKSIEAGVEYAVTALRLKQAQTPAQPAKQEPASLPDVATDADSEDSAE